MRHDPWLLIRHWALAALCLAPSAGCAGYRFGTDSLYPADIHTVYVPMFESDSFRPNLGERLTEKVIKQIESKTNYKVVNTPDADSVLTGRIASDTKRVLIESPTDESRELETNFQVVVNWLDRKGDLLKSGAVPLPPPLLDVGGSATVIPEIGQSIATGQEKTLDRLAVEIVGMMEAPW
ncbi:MAG: LptE family protein [Pirellulales bacterium]